MISRVSPVVQQARLSAAKTAGLVTALVILAGCASTPDPFPIQADPRARSLLTGEWVGTYAGGPAGRSGSISFVLQKGDSAITEEDGEHAHGDVLMIPSGQNDPVVPPEGPAVPPEPGNAGPQVLTINFVRARGTKVTGTLKPYRDPACNCILATTFSGVIDGDVITGTFSTAGPDGVPQTGKWEMRRKKA